MDGFDFAPLTSKQMPAPFRDCPNILSGFPPTRQTYLDPDRDERSNGPAAKHPENSAGGAEGNTQRTRFFTMVEKA